MSVFITALFFVFIFSGSAVAETADAPSVSDAVEAFDFGKVTDTEKERGEEGDIEKGANALYTDYRIKSSLYPVVILSVAQVVFLLIILFFLTKNNRYTPMDVVIVSGLALVIFGTIFVVLVVKTEQQLAMASGILGTIAGYLFGVRQKNASEGQDKTIPDSKPQ